MTYQLTTFNDLVVGQKAFLRKTITDADLSHFIAITGDLNPLHVDKLFAEQTFFGQRIAHGMLSASLFSTLVGMHLPGIGAIYKSQTLDTHLLTTNLSKRLNEACFLYRPKLFF